MIFSGELDHFNSADLLMILGQMEKEGHLTVSFGKEALFVGIRDGRIITAYSFPSDEKIFRSLVWRRLLDKGQLTAVSKIKEETGLPLKHVLEAMQLAGSSSIQKVLEQGMREVLFQFLLSTRGHFHFSDVLIGESPGEGLSIQGVILDLLHRLDEWNDTLHQIGPVSSNVTPTAEGREALDLPPDIQAVMDLAQESRTLGQILELAPMPSFMALQAVTQARDSGWLDIRNDQTKSLCSSHVQPDPLYERFHQSFEKIVLSLDVEPKVAAVAAFCQENFDQTLIIRAKHGVMNMVTQFFSRENSQEGKMDVPVPNRNLLDSPVFSWVLDSGSPFVGKILVTNLFEGIVELPDTGQCGIIPLENNGNSQILAFVTSAEESMGVSPFHYLELIGWLVSPTPENTLSGQQPGPLPPEIENLASLAVPRTLARDKANVIVKAIEDLPPMPRVVIKALDILGDPTTSMADLADALGKDPSLVARIIRVSNSALFSRGKHIANLNVALARLGQKAARSIVLITSANSMFSSVKQSSAMFAQDLWQHSMECGLASRCVARAVGYQDPEAAMAAGVLHDIGKLAILLRLPEQYPAIRRKQAVAQLVSTEAERQIMGFDHSMIGEMLLKKWGLPESLVRCAQYHHKPFLVKEDSLLVSIVVYGNILSHMFGSGLADVKQNNPLGMVDVLSQLQLSAKDNQALVEEIKEVFKNTDLE
ncbi:MAG: HDOD domain-containing protein [Desulfatibacillum sp.]|nr:HDOD domain-containing protein [Desulfatibacillum sp.]